MPRSTADLAILHILLRRTASGIEPNLVQLAAIGADHLALGIGNAVAEREFLVQELIIRFHDTDPPTQGARLLASGTA